VICEIYCSKIYWYLLISSIESIDLIMKKIKLSKELIYAIFLALLILALVITTTDQAPEWIYQGF